LLANMVAVASEVSFIERTAASEQERRRTLADAIAAETPALLAAARLLLLNETEAWDLAQTSIEIALRRSATLRDPSSLRPWLLVIQSREAFRFRRRMSRALSLDSVEPDSVSSQAPTVELASVREALACLPLRIRSAVVLHHMAGLSVIEAAEAMKVSPNTIKSQLKVGMTRLREALRDE
jgi:RNA polymerase sigma factor (sigma-70 family)